MQVTHFVSLGWLVAWLSVFFILNNLTYFRKCRTLHLPWDDRIPFRPGTMLVYFSTYAIFVLPLIVITDPEHFRRFIVGYTAIVVICSGVFLIFPTRVDRIAQLPATNFIYTLFNLFQRVCKPYNSFPSMHTAYAFAAALALYRFRSPALGVASLLWAAAIALSTLTARQHVLLDVIGGLTIGIAVSLVCFF